MDNKTVKQSNDARGLVVPTVFFLLTVLTGKFTPMIKITHFLALGVLANLNELTHVAAQLRKTVTH